MGNGYTVFGKVISGMQTIDGAMLVSMSARLVQLVLYLKVVKVVLRLIRISAWVVEHALQPAHRVQCATTIPAFPIKVKS